MEHEFDFDKIGKRMPYAVPRDAFEEIDENVRRALNLKNRPSRKLFLFRLGASLAAVGCLAMAIVMRPESPTPYNMLTEIDFACANLTEADREYLTDIYNDDIFINQR